MILVKVHVLDIVCISTGIIRCIWNSNPTNSSLAARLEIVLSNLLSLK
jgi:hypothetical protein